jgi:hypothetical protein
VAQRVNMVNEQATAAVTEINREEERTPDSISFHPGYDCCAC